MSEKKKTSNKQILVTRERSSMSLSCHGEMVIEDDIIKEVSIKGYPRVNGDSWVAYYRNAKIGDEITQEKIEKILSYDGKANVFSSLRGIK